MKSLKYILFLIVCMFSINIVYANDIKKITMDVYVDNNGNAHIKEEWTATLSSGTEGYKPYYNLGNSEIKDFKVSLNNKYFTTISSWDTSASFNEKSYKAGLNEIKNGYELCFGISKYGTNTYTMEYTITNFVSQTEDSDMIYWQLIPYDLSDKPDYVYIKIYSDFLYDFDLPVWGYGNYGGYAYVHEDGYIELIHEDALDSDEYMTVLVKFPKNTFNTSSTLDNDFEYYYEMAEDGATTYSDKTTIWDVIKTIFLVIVNFIPYIIVILIIIFGVNTSEYGTKKLKFNKGMKKIKMKEINYFRDIPCDKDLFKGYWVACQYGLVEKKTDFLGAILLKWLKNKNIENTTITSGLLKKEERAIKLLNNDGLNEKEKELYDMMLTSSGDGVLESNEFTKWCKKHYKKILDWFNEVIDNETMNFVNNGLIREENKIFKTYYVSDNMYEYAKEMAGLKKFLNEFSNISKRESIEVNLWEEYLMYAQIFGIAKKVAKEFKKLYPDVITDDAYNDVIFINTISYSGVSAASTARERAQSYSSGGGGFSSGGGGGGSFGGGGGGGGFR